MIWKFLFAATALAAANHAAADLTGDEVIDHLNRTIAWYEHISGADQSVAAPQNVILQENVRQASRQVVQKAFAFARAEAGFLNAPRAGGGSAAGAAAQGQARTIEQSAAAASERVQRLQSQIDEVNGAIAKAPRRKLAVLTSQRDTLNADLAFAKTSQKALAQILQFANIADKSGGLLGQINLLANSDSVPVALTDTPLPPAAITTAQVRATTQAAAFIDTFHPESAGMAALIGNTLALVRARNQIQSLITETTKLNDRVIALRAPCATASVN